MKEELCVFNVFEVPCSLHLAQVSNVCSLPKAVMCVDAVVKSLQRESQEDDEGLECYEDNEEKEGEW